MAFVSITRLRIRSWRFLPAFFLYAMRSSKQARESPGNLGMSVLNDARNTFWTRSAWMDESAMKAFMTSGPHLEAMKKLPNWCDEAAVVHWIQNEATLPDWKEAHRRLQREGRRSKVLYPSADHEAFEIRPPRVQGK